MSDFEQTVIEIRKSSDNWGPFRFNFSINSSEESADGLLPFGSTIADTQVKAYLGSVKPYTIPDPNKEITDNLFDPDIPIEIGANFVICYFNYPGEVYLNKNVTLIFYVTLSTGAKHEFYFQHVKIT